MSALLQFSDFPNFGLILRHREWPLRYSKDCRVSLQSFLNLESHNIIKPLCSDRVNFYL